MKCKLIAILMLVAVLGRNHAAAPDGVWFLELSRSGEQFELARSQWSQAQKFARQNAPGSHVYEIFSAENALLDRGNLNLRSRQLEAFSENGEIVSVGPEHQPELLGFRLPSFPGGAFVRIYPAPTGLSAPSKPVAEFQLRARELQAAAAEGELIPVLENGPRAGQVNIAILGDGFTESERAAFTNQARLAAESFLGIEPISSYAAFFNAYGIFMPSAESGSDHPARGQFRDTYFNSSYDSYGISYLLTIPPNNHDPNPAHGRDKARDLLASHLPEYDIAILLVNDTEYGGSGGVPAIASLDHRSANILIHEVGHSFAGLGDEYSDPYPGYPDVEEPNTTRETRREFIKWRDWIKDTTPIPTPEIAGHANDVGLFEGAHYHDTGWFRPKLDCMMKTLGKPFCEVCREAIVLGIHRASSAIARALPATNYVRLTSGEPVTFSIDLLTSPGNANEIEWRLNDTNLLAAGTNSVSLQPTQVGTELSFLTATVQVTTPYVRNDPFGSMRASHFWLIEPPRPPLLLLNPTANAAGQLTFSVNRSADPAILQTSTNLMDWTSVLTTNLVAGEPFTHTPSESSETLFLRLIEP